MPESPIRKLVPYAENAKKAGKKVYHLNIGQPDIHTPKGAIDAISNIHLEVLEYSHSAGIESYRNKLAVYYQSKDIQISKEDLLVTTGGSEALLFTLLACLSPGDEIIIPEPFYANYNGFAIMAGVNIKPITASIENGFALPPIAAFETLINNKTKAILICNPNNPTGYLYSKDELEQLKNLALKYDLFLIADEVYREFCYGTNKHHSILNLDGLENHAVVVDSVSKRYSMCGARIGAIISRNKTLMTTALKFAQARLSPPTLAQIAAEAALDTPDSYFDEVIEEYIGRRDTVVKGLQAIPGIKCIEPKGAFYTIIELPVDDADNYCQWLLESFNFNNETVMLAPASGFYANPELGKKQVRLAYVLKKEDLVKAVRCIAKSLEEYPGRN